MEFDEPDYKDVCWKDLSRAKACAIEGFNGVFFKVKNDDVSEMYDNECLAIPSSGEVLGVKSSISISPLEWSLFVQKEDTELKTFGELSAGDPFRMIPDNGFRGEKELFMKVYEDLPGKKEVNTYAINFERGWTYNLKDDQEVEYAPDSKLNTF